MVNTIELKSLADGSSIAFRRILSQDEVTAFEVSVRTPFFSGTAPASTYFNGPPSLLFAEMAKEWQGWAGKKSWRDLDGRVAFEATCDRLGHIKLIVELVSPDYESTLRAVITYEAGQLDAMYSAVMGLLG